MKTTTVILIVWLALALGSASAFFRECGRLAGGRRCPRSECCSRFGLCGRTERHCSDRYACQLDCWRHERPDERCGPDFDNPPCGENRCCNLNNWCGGSARHCAPDTCQYNCWPSLANGNPETETETETNTTSLEVLTHVLVPVE